MHRKTLILLILLMMTGIAKAQRTEYPMIGAQVFVEPGQTGEEIERYFATMEQCGMRFARIRMFGSHLKREGGYELYDRAFDAAKKHGIRVFATLFPDTDELNDVGGFKFPHSTRHLEEVDQYIAEVVTHYAQHPALYCWVLQNEPGTGGSKAPRTDHSQMIKQQWRQTHPAYQRGDGYLGANWDDEDFLRYTRELPRKGVEVIFGSAPLQDGVMEVKAKSTVVVAINS